MDGSIVLRNITHQDLGVYHCTITTFPLGSWSRDVTVEDQGRPGWGEVGVQRTAGLAI
jgi:hypothetical protein